MVCLFSAVSVRFQLDLFKAVYSAAFSVAAQVCENIGSPAKCVSSAFQSVMTGTTLWEKKLK